MPRLKLIAVEFLDSTWANSFDIQNPCFSFRKRKTVLCLFLNYCNMHCGITVCRLGRVLVTTSFHDEAFLFPIEAQHVALVQQQNTGFITDKICYLFQWDCAYLLNQTDLIIVQRNVYSKKFHVRGLSQTMQEVGMQSRNVLFLSTHIRQKCQRSE